jgi:hypothetical protein
MSVNVKINGIAYSGINSVKLPLVDGSGYAQFDYVNSATEVTLSSISATYSGGDVTVGTAVTDLTGIVVTATYSDGSTQTVTDYTLSGEITEGSNTITVNYSGKTTTFTVMGVAESEPENVVEFTDPIRTDGETYAKFYVGADNTTENKVVQGDSNICISEISFNAGDTVKLNITSNSFTGWDYFRVATYYGDWDGTTEITVGNTIDAYYTEGVGSDSKKENVAINHEYVYTMTNAGKIVVCTYNGGQNYKVTAEVM